MRPIIFIIFLISASYVVWACKVRIDEKTTLAAVESDLIQGVKFTCVKGKNIYPKFYDVVLNPSQAAIRFVLEDEAGENKKFKLVYFAHAVKFYDPLKRDEQYYTVRLGPNEAVFTANDNVVKLINYQSKKSRKTINCTNGRGPI